MGWGLLQEPCWLTRKEAGVVLDGIVPELMAVDEAACTSVHKANRLGRNLLLDIADLCQNLCQQIG